MACGIGFLKLIRRLFIGGLVGFLSLLPLQGKGAEVPLIAVASNLRFAIEEIAEAFEKETLIPIRFSFGSSGNLTRQILQGAPFDMFMSADESYPRRVTAAGKSEGEGHVYAYGRIAAFIPYTSPMKNARFPEGVSEIVANQTQLKLAIANPELAPYGRAAREAMQHAGIWDKVRKHLIYGENISQAGQFALSGSALGGIIAHSLALTPQFSEKGSYQLISADWHQPLAQRMVLLKGADNPTRLFYDFILSKRGQEILRRNGYSIGAGGDS